MKPEYLKNLLLSEIDSVSQRADEFSVEAEKHFTRKRKLPFDTVIKTIIGTGSKSLTNELIDAFDTESDMPSASVFVQQHCKIKAEAFKSVFDGFTSKLITKNNDELRILAVDGSDVQIATNPNDQSTYHPGVNG